MTPPERFSRGSPDLRARSARGSTMEAGAKVYYPDPAEAYLVATVKHVAGLGADAELTLVPEKGGELKKVAKECSEADLKSLDGVPDMQQMDSLTEASLLGCLRVRYLKGEIYSAVGETLLAMNPFSVRFPPAAPLSFAHAHARAQSARRCVRSRAADVLSRGVTTPRFLHASSGCLEALHAPEHESGGGGERRPAIGVVRAAPLPPR